MNLQHHFLIAMPALQDPIFRRSVVYICEHNTNGAMGIIVNKPLENLKIEGILEKLKITPEPRDESIRLDKPVMLHPDPHHPPKDLFELCFFLPFRQIGVAADRLCLAQELVHLIGI